MDGDRALLVLRDPDQWARCRHESTALTAAGVELDWAPEQGSPLGQPGEPAGLVFDRWCRAYRSRPLRGAVEVSQPQAAPRGAPGILRVPRGLAVDDAQRLYVAESGAGAVHVIDLWGQRLLRRVSLATSACPRRRPSDVAGLGCAALVLTNHPTGLLMLEGRHGPRPGPVLRAPGCLGADMPTRVAAARGQVLLLWKSAGRRKDLVATADGQVAVRLEHATDIELTGPGALVVARRPGEPFARFRQSGTRWLEEEPLRAPGYDGGAVSAAPDGRVAYTTERGWAWTAGSAARFVAHGRVLSYRLDSRAYRTRWGRLFLDACLPPGTTVRASFLSSDDDEVTDPVDGAPPARGAPALRFPHLTPPLPSRLMLQEPPEPSGLFRRPAPAPATPWVAAGEADTYAEYDTPVTAPPGRYLWVILDLTGTARATPRIRSIQVEAPGHLLTRQLPAVWSRAETNASFLQQLLAPAEGLLHEMDQRAALRGVLLDPAATPAEALSWLAGLLGVVLDQRWPMASRRTLVAEAFTLFRIRGTVACLERMLQVCLGRPVPVVENWRVRGLGGAVLGPPSGGSAPPAVATGTGDTSQLGRFTLGGRRLGQDGYTATAHRFTVLVPRDLGEDERPALTSLIEMNKPAHTEVTVCELGSGMRVGRNCRIDLTTVVGPDARWGPVIVGQVLVGGDGVIGLPAVGSRVQPDTAAGVVRVG